MKMHFNDLITEPEKDITVVIEPRDSFKGGVVTFSAPIVEPLGWLIIESFIRIRKCTIYLSEEDMESFDVFFDDNKRVITVKLTKPFEDIFNGS